VSRDWRATAPAVLAMAWGGNHFTPLLLLYRQVQGYSSVAVDLFLAFYIVGLVPGFLLAGPLSDRHGRKRLTLVGLVLGVVGSVVLALGADSAAWMCLGRLVSGVSVAIAMVVGTSWIKELSGPPFGAPVAPAVGARRASLTLTAGFALGAGVSGVLAQWGPAPTLLPYAVQIVLSALAVVPLLRAPETRARDLRVSSLLGDLRLPRGDRRRFLGVILPMAPWVFSAAGLAYAVTPALVADRVGGYRIAFATLLTVVTLGAGAGIQPFTGRIAALTRGRQALVGLVLAVVGTGLCALEATLVSPLVALLVGLVLGLSYGVCLVSGLVEVQRMAGPDDLAGLTGVYYSLTYVGFALPVALAALTAVTSYAVLLAGVTLVCLCCGLTVARNLRRGAAAA
jgi:predicted MFS family arabinose efflux permease